jgi:phage terminase large subunit
VLDEAEELIDENTFDTIDLSIREKNIQNRVILILNPATKEHWIYDRFFQSKGVEGGFNGVKDNVCYIHSTYLDPDSLTEVAIDKKHKKIYLKEHIYRNGLKSQELAQIILEKVDNKLIIADSAEPRLIADLKHLGVNIKSVKKGTIESGITRMQDYQLVVSPESTNIAKELNNYVYADKGSKLYVDNYNHAIDGIRYNVIYHLDNPNAGKYFVQ